MCIIYFAMEEKNPVNQGKIVQKSVKNGNGKKPFVESVPWQNQEICIVDNVDQCRDLAKKLQSYVENE